MLSKKVLADDIAEYEALDAQIEELKARQNAIKDKLTGEMDRRGVEELVVGNKVLRWKEYVQNRFDSNGFKKAFPEIYSSWQKSVIGHRFSVS